MVKITHDGETVAEVSDANEAFTWLLQHQGQSVDYALKHGGYSIETPGEPRPSTMAEMEPETDDAPNPAGDVADQVAQVETAAETTAHALVDAGETEAAAEVVTTTKEAMADVEEAVADAAAEVSDVIEDAAETAHETATDKDEPGPVTEAAEAAETVAEVAAEVVADAGVEATTQAAEEEAAAETVTETVDPDTDPDEQHWLYRDIFSRS